MPNELKPCPFCGNQAERTLLGKYTCSVKKCPGYFVECSLKDWNTRPIEDALNARIAELEAEVAELRKSAVVWHKYPDEKPESNGYGNRTCFVAFKYREFPPAVGCCDYYFPVLGIGEDGDGVFGFSPREGVVITHWAYLPAPPEEKC